VLHAVADQIELGECADKHEPSHADHCQHQMAVVADRQHSPEDLVREEGNPPLPVGGNGLRHSTGCPETDEGDAETGQAGQPEAST